jgi:hypothetical protein
MRLRRARPKNRRFLTFRHYRLDNSSYQVEGGWRFGLLTSVREGSSSIVAWDPLTGLLRPVHQYNRFEVSPNASFFVLAYFIAATRTPKPTSSPTDSLAESFLLPILAPIVASDVRIIRTSDRNPYVGDLLGAEGPDDLERSPNLPDSQNIHVPTSFACLVVSGQT